ncbi:MAG: serine/threonine protein kinase, partial [Myxococcales bacterium]|nr:serine/threonine protein kinase [Myxococcales bacterium]
MGEVWAGERQILGGTAKRVAVKTLLSDAAQDARARAMFLEEARLSMLLTNSNIVQVFDVGEAEDGTCYMAMEWVRGMNLAELSAALRARGERLPLVLTAFIVGELLKALAHAHDLDEGGERKTIVHRDASPHTLLLSVAGEVKLMDFGVARFASEETEGRYIKGKLRYMPPEQLRGESRAPTIDLFAVGAVLHELLDGRKFRDTVDEARLYGMIFDGEVPPLRCPEEVPPELEALRVKLLAAQVEERSRSAREAHQMLCRWSGYRDAKFELQDIVRSLVRPEPECAATTVVPTGERKSDATQERSSAARTTSDLDDPRSTSGLDAAVTELAPTAPSAVPASIPVRPRVLVSTALLASTGLDF